MCMKLLICPQKKVIMAYLYTVYSVFRGSCQVSALNTNKKKHMKLLFQKFVFEYKFKLFDKYLNIENFIQNLVIKGIK